MEKNPRANILFLTILMFWGIIYPQYTFTEDMYRVTDQEYNEVEKDCLRDYGHILRAKEGEVTIRFALLDEIREWLGE
ncbi:MAG: hypothetical protein IJ390_13890 [Lachnospiraceae bacterium]|nr:hypothetical protein [Lachnospiraceae bacterium]